MALEFIHIRLQPNRFSEIKFIAHFLKRMEYLVCSCLIGFIRDPWYDRLPYYCKAMLARLTLAATDPTKDARLAGVIDDLVADYDELCAEQPPGRLPDAVDDIGFLIEELRVQTWAQTLGTAVTVSPKRIRKAMQEARVSQS